MAVINQFQTLIFFSFNKLQWLYSVNLNLVLMCVVNVVNDTNSYVWIKPCIINESTESFGGICLCPSRCARSGSYVNQ